MPLDPLEARAFGPSVYRAARLLYHENPPTSKLNETPEMERESSKECSFFFSWRKGNFSSRNHPSRNSTLFS